MRKARRISSAVGLTLLTLLTLVLITPPATADTISPARTPTDPHPAPMALATTGLNITIPVVIGIVTLVLGIAVVAWAFLRTGSAEQHR